MNDYKQNIKDVLNNYKENIMYNAFGSWVDEYGEKYSSVYKHEWGRACNDLTNLLYSLKLRNMKFNDVILAYLIISIWHMSVTPRDEHINIDHLQVICQDIIIDLNNFKGLN